jgi:transcriptional regulator with XRE-family HTH domain
MGRPTNQPDASTFCGQVAAEIRRRRLAGGLSVQGVAAAAGVPVQTWYNWERGRHLPLERLPAIAAALDCQTRELVP